MNERIFMGFRIRVVWPNGSIRWVRKTNEKLGFTKKKSKSHRFEFKIDAYTALSHSTGCTPEIAHASKLICVWKRIKKKTNGGVVCDVVDGPCACGAWHKK
jgi:hypothetical protein